MVERIDPDAWQSAVETSEGPQMIVSGPGAGKTEFLVQRAVHLIDNEAVAPQALLMLSFSRRSAGDLRRRVEHRIGGSFTEVGASTFHALAARVLETYGTATFGWDRAPSLLTAPEHAELVRQLLATEDPARWPVLHRPLLESVTFAGEVAAFVQRTRELLIDGEELAQRVADRPQWRGLDVFIERYDRLLEEKGRIDYGTLQARAVAVLSQPAVAEELATAHPFILIDEFQDTTRVQAEMLRLLYAPHRNLTVTGDPYQSIYGFRGADPSNLTDFPTAFPAADGTAARHLALTTSFRVREAVLRAAERVTTGGAIEESAGPVAPAPGPSSVEVYGFTQQSEEAEWISGEVERLHLAEGVPYSAIGVLVRTKRRILSELSRALDRRGIPHDRPDVRSVDLPAVRVVLDVVLAATAEAGARAEALRRILLGPLYSVTLARWREFERTAARAGASWVHVLQTELPEAEQLAGLIRDPEWATDRAAAEGFWHLWSTLDRFELFVSATDESARRSLSSFSQVLSRLGERDPGATLVDYVRMVENEDFEALPLLGLGRHHEDRVALTTMHQAKGLEFDVVFLADAVEGVFPDLRSRDSLLDTRLLDRRQPADSADYARARLREEMRLAYTAMCRASTRVVWTATAGGITEAQGRPSRFLARVADTPTVAEALDEPSDDGGNVTPRAVVAELRRTVRNAEASEADRLAALTLLANRDDVGALAVGTLDFGPDTGVVNDEMTLSPSQAEAYDTCPLSYVLERRLHIGDTTTVYLLFGTLIHGVLEDVEGAALARGDHHGTLAEAMASLEARFDPADFGGEPWATGWRRRAEACLIRLYDNWPPDSLPVLAVEKRFEATLDDRPWVGIADRIEGLSGELRIVDYKTSGSPKPAADVADSLQLAFYALALADDAAFEGDVTAAEMWFPAAKAQSVTTRSLDLQVLDDCKARLVTAAQGIFAEDWTPTPGDHCRRCRVRTLCPEWPEGREAFA